MLRCFDSEFSILSTVEETHSHTYFHKRGCISTPVLRKEGNWRACPGFSTRSCSPFRNEGVSYLLGDGYRRNRA